MVAQERNEELRTQFLNDLAPYLSTPARLVFLDECGFNLALTRRYGRAPSDERAVGRIPRNWGKNQTLLCGLQCSGPMAPIVIEGSVTGDVFEWYVRELLCPALTPGQGVILDNLSAHHREEVQHLIQERDCTLLFLPASSPDFNPIELMCSKLKAWVRKGNWRSISPLIQAIGAALSAVSLQDIYGWFTPAHPTPFLCQML